MFIKDNAEMEMIVAGLMMIILVDGDGLKMVYQRLTDMKTCILMIGRLDTFEKDFKSINKFGVSDTSVFFAEKINNSET